MSVSARVYWETRHETAGPGWLEHYWQDTAAPHRALLLRELSSLPPFGSLLEVGCHVGPNLQLIRRAFPAVRLLGVDVNAAAIRFGQQAFSSDPLVELECADLSETLARKSARSVDVILSCYALAYLDETILRRTLASIMRVARVAVILAEPMGGFQCPPGPIGGLDYPEWRHDYHHMFEDLIRKGGRSARFFGRVVRPPADRLDGMLTGLFTEVATETRSAARELCPHCAAGIPHHTNGIEGIGDPPHRRHPVPDLHSVEDPGGVGLQECLAGSLWERYYQDGGKEGPEWR